MLNRCVVIIAAVLSLWTVEAIACSCASRGDFIQYAQGSERVITARVVSLGAKLSHGETLHASMTIEVLAALKGKLSVESIELLGDPGFLCRDYVDSRIFVVGREFVIALHGDEAVQPFGGCGEAWLELLGDLAKGYKLVDGKSRPYTIELDDLANRINAN